MAVLGQLASPCLPWELSFLAGYDKQLCGQLVGAFVKSVLDSLRRRAKRELGLRSVSEAHAGAITFILALQLGDPTQCSQPHRGARRRVRRARRTAANSARR